MRTRSNLAALLVAGAAAFMSSCAADTSTPADGPRAESSSHTAPTRATTETTAEGSAAPVSSDQIDPGLQPFIESAVADLASRLTVAAAAVTVTSATVVEWPDASLGCPAPGQLYAQVITEGALIVLAVDGTAYNYHAGRSGTPFLCEAGEPMSPPGSMTP